MEVLVPGRIWASVVVLACLLVAAPRGVKAQTVTPLPQLDLNRLRGTWYEIARYPNRHEKTCVRNAIELIALGDPRNSISIVNSCMTKKGYTEIRNGTARQGKKATDGRLKLTYFWAYWPFTSKYWVLGMGEDNTWLMIGSPNHKSLWLFSSSAVVPAETLGEIKAQAAAQGFSVDKLQTGPQTARAGDGSSGPAAVTPTAGR